MGGRRCVGVWSGVKGEARQAQGQGGTSGRHVGMEKYEKVIGNEQGKAV